MPHFIYAAHTDEALVEAARGGELSALNELIKRHQNFIYNVALRYALRPTTGRR